LVVAVRSRTGQAFLRSMVFSLIRYGCAGVRRRGQGSAQNGDQAATGSPRRSGQKSRSNLDASMCSQVVWDVWGASGSCVVPGGLRVSDAAARHPCGEFWPHPLPMSVGELRTNHPDHSRRHLLTMITCEIQLEDCAHYAVRGTDLRSSRVIPEILPCGCRIAHPQR
jgi:hypothetical protein